MGQAVNRPRREAEVWAIVVAAGSGSRFGSKKQFTLLSGRAIVDWALDAARAVATGVVLVVPADSLTPTAMPLPRDGPWTSRPGEVVVAGGPSRSASVRAGLRAVPGSATIVVVHDAARPLAPPALFEAVVTAVARGADGAVPGVAVRDTVKRVAGGDVVETLRREDLVAVQTPQAFDAEVLRRAHEPAGEATDDAALVEAIGGRVVVVAGDPANLKLTTPADLAWMETLTAGRLGTPHGGLADAPAGAPSAGAPG